MYSPHIVRRTYPNLAAFLKDTNTSQAQFARQLGVRPSYVNMIILGDRTPALPLALRIADIARIPLESLIGHNDKAVAS